MEAEPNLSAARSPGVIAGLDGGSDDDRAVAEAMSKVEARRSDRGCRDVVCRAARVVLAFLVEGLTDRPHSDLGKGYVLGEGNGGARHGSFHGRAR